MNIAEITVSGPRSPPIASKAIVTLWFIEIILGKESRDGVSHGLRGQRLSPVAPDPDPDPDLGYQ